MNPRPLRIAAWFACVLASVVIDFKLVPHGQNINRVTGLNFIQRHVPRVAEWSDQLAQTRIVANFALNERRAAEMALHSGLQGIDGRLRRVKIFNGLRPFERKIEQAKQVITRRCGVTDFKSPCHPPSTCLRLASSRC